MKPWKSWRLPRWFRGECTRFNGATAMKPWKRAPTRLTPTGIRSFNGATAMKPWKRQPRLKAQTDQIQLQWGHGDEAVEEPPAPAPNAAPAKASMGPRR